MFAYIEFKKLDKVQIELSEDYRDRTFELLVNQVPVLKCCYATADKNSYVQFTTIRDSILQTLL